VCLGDSRAACCSSPLQLSSNCTQTSVPRSRRPRPRPRPQAGERWSGGPSASCQPRCAPAPRAIPSPFPSLPFPSSSSPRRRGGRCGFVLFIAASLPRCGLGYCCCRREESFFFLFDRMMLEDSCVRTRLVWLLARCSAAGCPAGGFGGGFFALLFGSPLAGRLLGQWELLFFPEGTLLGFPVLVPLPVRDRIFWWIGGATIPMIMNHRRVDCPCDFRFLIGLPIARSELR
jgi:hypothetical protein